MQNKFRDQVKKDIKVDREKWFRKWLMEMENPIKNAIFLGFKIAKALCYMKYPLINVPIYIFLI